MENLHRIIIQESVGARKDSLARRPTHAQETPSAAWTSRARISSDVGNALSVVLATQGCAHARGPSGGCTMCSYLLDGSREQPSSEQLEQQFARAISKLDGTHGPLSVKLYTSGSFLDPEEVPLSARASILARLKNDQRIRQVVVESRPEFVSDENMIQLRNALGEREIELGVGLESSSAFIRRICINKGFSTEDFRRALETARAHGIGIRAYVLVKPPFLTERDALLDSIKTAQDAAAMGVTTVSFNPVNVQKYTLVERMWSRGEYRPPWLWTVLEVLRRSRESLPRSVNVVCDPVAAGKGRGTHNCGKCDGVLTASVRSFSLTQEVADLGGVDCECLPLWRHILEHEDSSLLVHDDLKSNPEQRL